MLFFWYRCFYLHQSWELVSPVWKICTTDSKIPTYSHQLLFAWPGTKTTISRLNDWQNFVLNCLYLVIQEGSVGFDKQFRTAAGFFEPTLGKGTIKNPSSFYY